MLDAAIKGQLKAYLEKLQRPIELVASLDDTAKSRELKSLLDEITALSDNVSARLDGNSVYRPSFGVARPGETPRIEFAGIPLGHEFTSLVLALLHTGGHPARIDAATLEQIKAIDGQFHFDIFVSLSCHNCPDVVQAVNTMAAQNPNISATMIDGALFQGEVEKRQIMAVPSVYLNGQHFGQGRMTLEEILAKIDTGAAEREAKLLNGKVPFDVLVVGGGPAGSAAAIYAARKGIRTGVVAERFGGQVLDTLAIENFISVTETEGPKLAMALEQHVKEYDVDVMNLQKAAELIPGDLIEVKLASGASLKSKSVILTTGARWREMNVPGEKEYRGKGVAYCPHCDGPLFKGKRVAVIGGGNSGVEAAIDLAGIVAHVTLLEFDSTLRADAVLQRKLLSLPNVTVITEALTSEVLGDGQKVTGLTYKNRNTDDLTQVELEGIFVQIGLLPNTDWLKGTVALSQRGEIEINTRGETSVPGVFAAGDCTTVPYKQIIIAMGAGSTAALGAFDHLIRASAP
ncbi:alkyl hydroperoxide reductase subunit F [Cellvibrio japonicus]|uniref:Alkyl hydroperoxide reductase subunit F n=1 Tax=Cellvibrio japonicus (strain Ueda107) TaxID=498211 RepID=B3PI37_CELJU|nr:alkyl hydroperoxide reductase subunit F [Cellvibrio japonicus]ACE84838.1 AhpF [Cellvibrio japonicus Ueda107]QEI11088.1 alkyl hydroperoxide reductase subunit F [Cellvibrio japonicus]QEI14662.1 alkyl hydroperoxide reductase subunit F [Cellvibrio japonicus]QEI18242.1 alkyl hydroperoxide reductase subunit F [Cellvibrio japonicus]